jgi:hypothetical protein
MIDGTIVIVSAICGRKLGVVVGNLIKCQNGNDTYYTPLTEKDTEVEDANR